MPITNDRMKTQWAKEQVNPETDWINEWIAHERVKKRFYEWTRKRKNKQSNKQMNNQIYEQPNEQRVTNTLVNELAKEKRMNKETNEETKWGLNKLINQQTLERAND